MAERTALLLGASGLIGAACLQELLAEERYSRIVALVRRLLPIRHPKLAQHVVDFARHESFADLVRANDVFSCLGTTLRKTPSREAYRRIDFDLPLEVARLAAERGAERLLLVSSVGADARSPFFYTRLKGELDEAAARLLFGAVHVFRPSLLLGTRAERRPAEAAMQAAASLYSPLLVGPLRRYKPVRAERVARAMVLAALGDRRGVRFYEFDEISALGLP